MKRRIVQYYVLLVTCSGLSVAAAAYVASLSVGGQPSRFTESVGGYEGGFFLLAALLALSIYIAQTLFQVIKIWSALFVAFLGFLAYGGYVVFAVLT